MSLSVHYRFKKYTALLNDSRKLLHMWKSSNYKVFVGVFPCVEPGDVVKSLATFSKLSSKWYNSCWTLRYLLQLEHKIFAFTFKSYHDISARFSIPPGKYKIVKIVVNRCKF